MNSLEINNKNSDSNLISEFISQLNDIKSRIKNKEILSLQDAHFILEYVVDTMIEFNNGVKEEDFREAIDLLFGFRDLFFNELFMYSKNSWDVMMDLNYQVSKNE
jgi:hypothetical protein